MMTETTAEHDVWIVVAPGLERVLCQELASLGVTTAARSERGGVQIALGDRELAAVVLHSRIAESVRVRIMEATAPDERRLDRHLARVQWARWLGAPFDLRVDASAKKSRLFHTGLLESHVVEAIRTACRGVRLAADPENAKVRVWIRMEHDNAVVRVEVGRPRMHRRGWRGAVGVASLRETIASATLRAAGWAPPTHGEAHLADPCCGAGTLLIETASLATAAPPTRDGPLLLAGVASRWPDSPLAAAWQRAEAGANNAAPAKGKARDLAGDAGAKPSLVLWGSDRDKEAVAACRVNEAAFGASSPNAASRVQLHWRAEELSDAIAALPAGAAVICNLPWGRRTDDDAYVSMRRFAGALRSRRDLGLVAVLDGSGRAKDAGLRGRVALRFEQGGVPVSLIVLREAEAVGAPSTGPRKDGPRRYGA